MKTLRQLAGDVRSAARILTATPALSATVIGLVALVIGGNTTIFSLVHTILTSPARGVHAERLVTIEHRVDGHPEGPEHSIPDYVDFAAQSRTVSPLIADVFDPFALVLDSGTYAIRGSLVTSNYFDTLGVRLARGRSFTADESDGRAALAVVISHRLWEDQLQRVDDVIGRSIVIDGHPATIVGVTPPDFQGLILGQAEDVFLPLVAYSRLHGTEATLHDRSYRGALVFGRLASGASMAAASAEFAAISARLQASYPETNQSVSAAPLPYSMMAGGNSAIATQGPRFLAIFSIVTILTLAIVCANVANLLLARVVARQREMAVRRSLGASRGRILVLLAAEGLLLSSIAWVAACGVAWWTARTVVALLAPDNGVLVAQLDFTPDWRVLGYAMLLAMAAALAFTVAPAVRTWRQELLPFLKSGEHTVAEGRSRLAGTLAVVQLAFTVTLLTSAGLAYRSLRLIDSADPGFARDHLLLVRVNSASAAITRDQHRAFLEKMRARWAMVPGVLAATHARSMPPYFANVRMVRTSATAAPVRTEIDYVGPGYLNVLGLRPVSGRDFAVDDTTRAMPLAIVDRHLADTLWPGLSAVGQMLALDNQRSAEIVGVSPYFRLGTLTNAPPNHVLVLGASPGDPSVDTFVIRYAGSLETLTPALRSALREADPRVPIVSMRTMVDSLAEADAPVRAINLLLSLFATGSLVIAAIGLYGVIAFNVRKRTRDFGVRIALGASPGHVLRSVLGEGAALTAIGLVAGFALSAAAATAMRGVLVGVTPTDVPTYSGVFALLTGVALIACYLPARRAAMVDPIQALRSE